MYADMLLKPEEIVLLRPTSNGGLGLISTKCKAMATLIHSFIEVAANPTFLNSQFLNSVFRAEVLNEDLSRLNLPPYYNNEFFQVIRSAKDSGNDIITMSTKAWYNFLLRDVIMSRDDNQLLVLSPCRIEQNLPDNNWSHIWHRARLKALSSDATSFCFKMLHNLLPTEYRLSTILRNVSPTCKFSCHGEAPADLQHCLLTCNLVQNVGKWLLSLIELQLESEPLSVDVISLNLDLSD